MVLFSDDREEASKEMIFRKGFSVDVRNRLVGKTRKIVLNCNTEQNLYIKGEIEYLRRMNTVFYIRKLCFNNLSECSEGVYRHSAKLDIIVRINLDFQKAFNFVSYSPKTF